MPKKKYRDAYAKGTPFKTLREKLWQCGFFTERCTGLDTGEFFSTQYGDGSNALYMHRLFGCPLLLYDAGQNTVFRALTKWLDGNIIERDSDPDVMVWVDQDGRYDYKVIAHDEMLEMVHRKEFADEFRSRNKSPATEGGVQPG